MGDATNVKRSRLALELFEAACRMEPAARRRWLERRCAADPDLHRQVADLLAADENGNGPIELAGGTEAFLAAQVDQIGGGCARAEKPAVGGSSADSSGRYRIIRAIGEGGMGTVYEAEQAQPRRIVALKAIRPGLVSPQMLRRFEYEAHILGRLQHPGIAQIYEAGVSTGPHGPSAFLAMEFVRGEPLDEYARRRELDARARLSLIAKVCDAVQYAHQVGVVHRDLKPLNILVDEHGQPKILDFGVARTTDGDQPLTLALTCPGQLIGTLPYMSPEQVSGDPGRVDTRTDVYALGVILYELLAGRLPIDLRKCTIPEAAERIRDHQPTRLGIVDRQFRDEVETIVAKALEKDAARRYQTAGELARDLRHYLLGEPIEARGNSALYVLRKTVGRYQKTVWTGIAFLVLLTTFSIVATIQAERNRRLVNAERRAHEEAHAEGRRADDEARELRRTLYFARIGFAQAALAGNDVDRVTRLLRDCPSDLRGWEWYYLARLADQSLATLDWGREGLVSASSSASQGRLIVARPNGRVGLVDMEQRSVTGEFDPGRPWSFVALSPDAARFVMAERGGGAAMYDTADGRELLVLEPHHTGQDPRPHPARSVAFSADASRVAIGAADGAIGIWDARTGRLLHMLWGHARDVLCVDFTPDGQHLVSGSSDRTVRVWAVESGQLVLTITTPATSAALAISPDSRKFATGGVDAVVRLWDLDSGAALATFVGHHFLVQAVRFDPAGTRLLSGGGDYLIKIWDVESGEVIQTLRGHPAQVRHLTFTADGQALVSADQDGHVKWWPSLPRADTPTIQSGHRQAISVDFSPDGRRLLSAGSDGTARVWDPESGAELLTLAGHTSAAYAATFRPDGRQIATGSFDRTVRLWDAQAGELVCTLRGHAGGIYMVNYSPDGTRLVSTDDAGALTVWSVPDGREVWSRRAHEGTVFTAAYSPDGRRIVSGGVDTLVKVWDAETGFELLSMPGHERLVYCACYSPDGGQVASVGEDGVLRVWDAATGVAAFARPVHRGALLGVCYSPDGSRLVTGGDDRTVRVWEARTGQEILTLRGHVRLVQKVAFSPDGRRIASSSDDGTIRLWETEPVDAQHLWAASQ